jgi:putative ABC transport system permease protein
MNLTTIAFKSLRQRALSSVLTSFSVALGVMLMVAVLVIYGIVSNIFSQNSIGYDLIIGPKGSELQLVLSTVYRISPPIENLPYSFYRQFKERKGIEAAIPVALGDTTEQGNFPICGTTPEYFAHEYAPRREFKVRGEFFRKPFQAVIGAQVARTNHWDLGTKLKLVHGGADTGGHVHDEEFEVVGVLAPTGTPNDKTVFVHLAGFYSISGHDKPLDEGIIRERAFYNLPALSKEELAKEVAALERKYGHHNHEHKPGTQHFHDIAEVQKEVTSILVKIDSDPKYMLLPRLISSELKDGFQAQAVNPIIPMRQLMDDVLGNIRSVLLVLTGLIILVSGIGIFVSIYNSMAARKREIAILRALGAQRTTVFSIILAESIILCVGGGLAGLLLGHGLVFAAAPLVEARSGLLIDPWKFEPMELSLIPALIVLASLVGFLPGLTAYRTDVAEALSS